jgi:hypothetical protein
MKHVSAKELVMRTVFTSTFSSTLTATAFAGLLGSLVAAQGQSVPVDIQGPGSVDVVLVSATTGPGGKVLTTTDASGKGSISAEDDKLINGGKWDVYEETCPGKDRVLLAPAGAQIPDGDSPNCKRRKKATILVKPGAALNLSSGGMSAGTKALIGVGAGGGAVAAVLLATKSGGSNNQTPSTTGSGTGTTPGSNNGSYEVNEAATTNTCGLAATVPVNFTVSADVLQGAESIGGTNFTFAAASSNGTSFSGSNSAATPTETFSITTMATFATNSVTLTQNIIGQNATSSATCAYNLTGTANR